MALIPLFFLDCVVAIGVTNADKTKSWVGTGFLVGRFFKKTEDGLKKYHVFLVTNKHVLNQLPSAIVRFNPQTNQPSKDYELPLVDNSGNKKWTGHPKEDIDVAVININPTILRKEEMRFSYFQSDEHISSFKKMTEMGITEGDFVYVLGFPMGIVSERQYVIARSGSIARIRDMLEKRSNEFLIDAFVFPGNSGGPVINKPEVVSITGTKASSQADLIGIVKSYVPYQDVAISQQTRRPRVIFEENSGLATVIPADFIMETVEIVFSTMKIEDEGTTEKDGA